MKTTLEGTIWGSLYNGSSGEIGDVSGILTVKAEADSRGLVHFRTSDISTGTISAGIYGVTSSTSGSYNVTGLARVSDNKFVYELRVDFVATGFIIDSKIDATINNCNFMVVRVYPSVWSSQNQTIMTKEVFL